LLETEIDLIDAESRYQVLEVEATSGILAAQNTEEQRNRIKDEFLRDPEVASLREKIKATLDDVQHSKEITRPGRDPARIAAQKHLKELNDKYADLWRTKSKEMRERLIPAPAATGTIETPDNLKREIERLKLRKARLSLLRGRFKDDTPSEQTTHGSNDRH